MHTIALVTEGLRCGKAPIRSVSFDTAPVRFDRDEDEEDGGADNLQVQ
jgi:hypothetical protein